MLALCLTVIGLLKIYASLQRITTLADNLLAICLVAFLLATICSYLALRAISQKRIHLLTQIADWLFLSGLTCATAVALFIAFVLAG
jgi:nitrate reductase gamma subunit